MNSEESTENGIKRTNHKKKKTNYWEQIVSALITGLLCIAFIVLILGISSQQDYDVLVSLDQNATSNESSYTASVYVVGQELESSWKTYTTYLPHESTTITKATELRSNYNTALQEGDSVKAINAAL